MCIARQPVGREFRSGERVPFSGLYAMNDGTPDCAAMQVVLILGQMFPNCRQCGAEATFTLVNAVPYIHEDPDFPRA
jgi:hypothetical protein